MTIWRMRIAYSVTEDTNTHSEYVIHCFSTATMIARTGFFVTLYTRTLPILF